MGKVKLEDVLEKLDNSLNPYQKLIKFYELLGWDKQKNIDPTKVRLNEEDLTKLLKNEIEQGKKLGFTAFDVGFLWLNKGPGGDSNVEKGTVLLKDGWQM